jgi:hypothetical protein
MHTRSLIRLGLIHAACAILNSGTQASTNNFVVPAFRGLPDTEAGYWESFTVPFGAPGNAADRPGSTTGAILAQTLSPSAFITGSGNIYDVAARTGFEIRDAVPFTLGTVVLQTRTLGSEIDYAGLTFRYSNSEGIHSVAPLVRLELDRGTILGASVSSLWQWDLRGLNVKEYTVTFESDGPSLSFDAFTLDTSARFEAVPEPSTWALLAAGLTVLFWRAGKRSS